MDSITKPQLSHDQLSAICKKYLCEDLADAEELKDGWFNAAFLLTGKDGKQAVLKSAPPDSVRLMRYEDRLMQAEVASLRLVKHMTNIPVPAVIAHDTSRTITETELFLAERIAGKPLDVARPNLSADTQEAIDSQVGLDLKELHRTQGPRFGTFNQPDFSSWPEAFGFLMEWLEKDAMDLKVELPHKTFRAADHLMPALEEVRSPVLVHWDLWDGNVFVDPETGKVTGYIDFERTLWADPLIEANFRYPKQPFLEAYGEEILDSDGAKARCLLYDLYLFLIMVVECRFRHFTAEHEVNVRQQLDRGLEKIKQH